MIDPTCRLTVLIASVLMAIAGGACSSERCGGGAACPYALMVQFDPPLPKEQRVLFVEVELDNRILRCRSSTDAGEECDGQLTLYVRPPAPVDAGEAPGSSPTRPEVVQGVAIHSASRRVTVRVFGDNELSRESTHFPTYRDEEQANTCNVCRRAHDVVM